MVKSSLPLKKSGSPAKNTTRGSRRKQSSIVCAQEGVGLSDVDFVAFYDKPILKIRTSARNLRRFCSARAAIIRDGNAALGAREAISKEPVAQRAEAIQQRV